MNVLKIVVFMLILIISMGCASAADFLCDDLGDEGHDNLEIMDDEVSEIDLKPTFTDLENNISTSGDFFELDDDYAFNGQTDSVTGVLIDRNNFTINGNNHVLDAKGGSRIFNITADNVTISNLVFINGNATRGGAIYSTGTITLNNVTFKDNCAIDPVASIRNPGGDTINCGGAIANYGGTVNCNNSRFIDNYAESSSAIFMQDATLNLANTWITSSIPNMRGQIYVRRSTVDMYNVDFVNISSDYAPALYLESCKSMSVIDSRFVNLTANISAGAIAVKRKCSVYIRGCEFVNTKSFKNAGAINVDYIQSVNVTVLDTLFENCSSMIGGAYIQLEGNLFMNNTRFINNLAGDRGGALYLAFINSSKISNCIFDSNVAEGIEGYGMGGAIYSDYNNISINDSLFLNNSAYFGGAIYAVDTNYEVGNSTFENDSGAIFTVFDKKAVLENNTFNNESVITNTTFYYASYVDSPALEFERINNTINVTNLPSRFDSRDWGWMSPVKSQGKMGSCWTFGMMGVLESAMLRAYGVELDLSEVNLFHNMLRYSPYGCIELDEGGYAIISASYLISWYGPAFEEEDIYDEVGKLSVWLSGSDAVHVQDVMLVQDDNVLNATKIKSAIMNYGSLTISYFAVHNGDEGYFNINTSAQYINKTMEPNHAVSVIGWDDNYSKDNFLVTPPGDGAWIFKNSWGTLQGDNGIFYISYYDKTITLHNEFYRGPFAIMFENTVPYNKNYQHDYLWSSNFTDIDDFEDLINLTGENDKITYSVLFDVADDDLIAAVGTYFKDAGVNYTAEIYVNGDLKLTQKGVSPFAGYHTIKLNEYVPIKRGDVFEAVMTSNVMPYIDSVQSRIHYTENLSFIYCGDERMDLYLLNKSVASLKVYTVADDSSIIANKDISVDYDGGKYFSVNVVTSDGHAVAGAKVTFTINKRTVTVPTDNNGIAKIKISDVPGKYTIKTAYNGKTYANKVVVNHVLKATKGTVKKTSKKFTLKATLKINGKAVKGKWITFKFNGKTYKVKTNSKGVAQKTLNKKVINNLKKGKTYTVKVTYLKDVIKTTVKVR